MKLLQTQEIKMTLGRISVSFFQHFLTTRPIPWGVGGTFKMAKLQPNPKNRVLNGDGCVGVQPTAILTLITNKYHLKCC